MQCRSLIHVNRGWVLKIIGACDTCCFDFLFFCCVEWHLICCCPDERASAWNRKQKWYTQSYEIRITGQFYSSPSRWIENEQFRKAYFNFWLLHYVFLFIGERSQSKREVWHWSRRGTIYISSIGFFCLLVFPSRSLALQRFFFFLE